MFTRVAIAGALALFLSAPVAQAAPKTKEPALNKLTPAEKKAGWKLLFDGKTLTGWKGYKKPEAPPSFQVIDGAIVRVADGGDLVSVEQYDNFELTLEWKLPEAGNSGIIFRADESEAQPWQTGPEFQLLDNAKHKDGKNPLTSTGACYAVYPPTKDATKPVGEWNSIRLVANGPQLEHYVNGEKVLAYEMGNDDWNQKVAASKFKKYPNFGKLTKGHIVLQDHKDRVEFRNIKLRVLPAKKMAAN
jgi:hypothetical protein